MAHVNAIEFNQVTHSYVTTEGQSVTALRDLDLVIPAGKLTVLVGPTGCGKTTVLNLAAGHLQPDQGQRILMPGLRLDRDLAYVFQHYTLLPWLCLWKNVALGLKFRRVSRAQRKRRAFELIEQVGLAGREQALPHELSGGMRQRAALAQALAIEPKLLLMDEPFGALDDATRCELQAMLVDLHRRSGMTILFVTHNIDEAVGLADRVIVFGREGRILDQVPVDLSHPRDRTSETFTELFLRIRGHLTR